MKRKRRTQLPVAPGTLPGTLRAPAGSDPKSIISLTAYDGDIRQSVAESVEQVKAAWHGCKVIWVDVDGLGDVEKIAEIGRLFNLHPLALEDVVNQNQRSKVEEYDDNYFIVVHAPRLEKHDFTAHQLSLIMGGDFVITFHQQMKDRVEAIKQNLQKQGAKIAEFGADYLAYTILDTIVDQYFPILEKFGELTDDTEDQMLVSPKASSVGYAHTLKRELLEMRRAIWPFRDALAVLIRNDSTPLITAESRPYFRDLYDHTVRVIDLIETYREVTSDLMDIYLSSVNNRTNEVMKRLTAITTIMMPLTLITGIYGMNFENMPETRTWYGYFIALAVMGVIAIGLLIYFYRLGWVTDEDDS